MTDGMDARTRLSSQVIVGDRDYLFHRDHEAIEQLSGESRFSQHELLTWRNVLETRQAWCKANDIEFRFMIVPEKHVVYQDLLPAHIKISDQRPAMQLLSSLPAEVRKDCFYPLEELRTARAEGETYLKTDTHWSWRGGYLAYRILMASIAERFPGMEVIEPEHLEYRQAPYIGDLGVRLEPEMEEEMELIDHRQSPAWRKVLENKVFSRGALSTYQTEERDGGLDCVIFRDSFANYIIPHLIPTFHNLTVLSSINMHYDLVRLKKPDVVIFEIIERFLGSLDGNGMRDLPTDLSGPTIESFTGISF